MKQSLHFLLIFFLFSVGPVLSYGQSTDASISGQIKDSKGEALPGVTVSIQSSSNGFRSTNVTNAEGRYAFRQLPLGRQYLVKASFIGFTSQVIYHLKSKRKCRRNDS